MWQMQSGFKNSWDRETVNTEKFEQLIFFRLEMILLMASSIVHDVIIGKTRHNCN